MSPPPYREFLGAVAAAGTIRFRVWTPVAQRVEEEFAGGGCKSLLLSRAADGYFSGTTTSAATLYKYRVDAAGESGSRAAAPIDRRTAARTTSGYGWQAIWNSESSAYGGHGAIEPVADHSRGAWCIQAQCAVLRIATPRPIVPEVSA